MGFSWGPKASHSPRRPVPENLAYVSPDRAAAFIRGLVAFSHGKVVSDDTHAAGIEIGRADSCRRSRIGSNFGRMPVCVTDGHLPYPNGREMTGYEVADLQTTLSKAKAAGVTATIPHVTELQRHSRVTG